MNILKKEDIIRINKHFHEGVMINAGSLDYVLSEQDNWLQECAEILRAILVDHVFEEGNKRTGAAVLLTFLKLAKVKFSKTKVAKIIVEIILKNINDVNQIKKRIISLNKTLEREKLNINRAKFNSMMVKVLKEYKDVFSALLKFEETGRIKKID